MRHFVHFTPHYFQSPRSKFCPTHTPALETAATITPQCPVNSTLTASHLHHQGSILALVLIMIVIGSCLNLSCLRSFKKSKSLERLKPVQKRPITENPVPTESELHAYLPPLPRSKHRKLESLGRCRYEIKGGQVLLARWQPKTWDILLGTHLWGLKKYENEYDTL